jgi:hypothetical protein
VVIRTHPVNFVLKPTYVNGRTVPPDKSDLRMVDDYTFQAAVDRIKVSVNNASDTRHLPPIHLASLRIIIQHLKYVFTANAVMGLLNPSLCHSAGQDERVGFKIDISRAYRNCAVLPAHCWMLAHLCNNPDGSTDMVVDNCYPFGMKQSTKVWTVIGTLLNCSIQSQGIATFDYSDDFMGITTPVFCESDLDTAITIIQSVGLEVNAGKLELEGALEAVKTFLGVRVDVQKLSASLCPLRCTKLLAIIEDMLQHRGVTAASVKSLAHKLLFVSDAVPYAAAMTIELFAYASHTATQCDGPVVSPCLAEALRWWRVHLPRFRDHVYSFHPNDEPWYPSDVVFTDASGHGFGGVSARYHTVFQGIWTALERTTSITHREAFAVLLAVLRFAAASRTKRGHQPRQGESTDLLASVRASGRLDAQAPAFVPAMDGVEEAQSPTAASTATPQLSGADASSSCVLKARADTSPPCLVVMCDNLGAVNIFDKGFSSDPVFGYILRITAQVLHQCQFHLRVFHVSGVFNTVADLASRQPFAALPASTLQLQLSTVRPSFRWLLETAISTSSCLPNTTSQDRSARERHRSTGATSLVSSVCSNPYHGLSLTRTISSYRSLPSISSDTASATTSPWPLEPSAAMFPPFVRAYLSSLGHLSSATQLSRLSLSDSVRMPLLDGIVSLLPVS